MSYNYLIKSLSNSCQQTKAALNKAQNKYSSMNVNAMKWLDLDAKCS